MALLRGRFLQGSRYHDGYGTEYLRNDGYECATAPRQQEDVFVHGVPEKKAKGETPFLPVPSRAVDAPADIFPKACIGPPFPAPRRSLSRSRPRHCEYGWSELIRRVRTVQPTATVQQLQASLPRAHL